MINITDKSKCMGCRACESACPQKCIYVTPDEEGFLYPTVDTNRCSNCGLCEKICPISNFIKVEKISKAFGAINKNDDIRENSSSGGAFYLIAQNVIEKGGVVFGAKFDENFKVIHGFAEDLDAVKEFQGSKYVQSDINDTFIKAKEFLNNGRLVLFSGTPCQIGGLKAFLKKDYYNLICQDIICHGVPSPKVWGKYIEFREVKAASKTRRTFFRHKKYGWKMYSVQFKFSNCTEYIQLFKDDLYMCGFMCDIFLRPSCYDCKFKASKMADITLADFWGVENIASELYDDKGTSLIIVNSEKGQSLLNEITGDMICKEVKFDDAVSYNSAYLKSSQKPKYRQKFMKEIFEKPFDKTINKYGTNGIRYKLNRAINKILRIM